MPAKTNLGDKPYSLDALGAQLDPKTHREWKKALNARAEAFLKGESGMGSSFRRSATRTITDLLYRVEPNEVQKQQARIDTALAKLNILLGDIIASDDYRTEGIGPAGTMVDVPRRIAHQLKIDMQDNILTTLDDGMIWRAVTVRGNASVEGTATAHPSPAAKSAAIGRPSKLQARIRQHFSTIYPEGTDATTTSLVEELKAGGIHASASTVERALGRRRDSDRSAKVRPK